MHGGRRSVGGHALAQVGVQVLGVVAESRLLLLLTVVCVGVATAAARHVRCRRRRAGAAAATVVAVLGPTRLLLVAVNGSWKRTKLWNVFEKSKESAGPFFYGQKGQRRVF